MSKKSSELGGSGPTNMDTKSKEYWAGYQAGINSCNNWKDFHPSFQKETQEYKDYEEGFRNALDDLVHAWGSTGC